jgi:PmbA protein
MRPMELTLQEYEARVLELAGRRAAQAETFTIESSETPVVFEANRLKQLRTRRTRGVALRVIVDGRVGLASTTRLEDPRELVEDALAAAQFGAEATYSLPAQCGTRQVALYDPQVEAVSIEAMVEMGQRMIDRARAEKSELLCQAELEKYVTTVRIANSAGASGSYKKSAFSAGLSVNLIRGTDMLDVWEMDASCRLEFDPDALAERVLHKVRLAERTAGVPTAQLPVILTPKGAAGALLESLASGFNAKMVLEGASPVGDKLGKQAFSPKLTLYDDGLIDFATPSAPFDDEGSPTQRTTLVRAGVVESFLYDLRTAALAGAQTTGNGSRSLGSLPAPAHHTLWVEPGQATLEEMLADIKEGLLVDQTMGAWAGNTLAGEFSGNVHLGYRIENGELVGRVKDTMVAGNVFQALGDIAAVGKELFWVGGSLRLPYLYLPALGVASKAG